MEAVLKQILEELQALKAGQDVMQTEIQALQVGQDALRAELKEFRDSSEVTNKLLIGDASGIKNQLRDLRDDMKEFRREVRD